MKHIDRAVIIHAQQYESPSTKRCNILQKYLIYMFNIDKYVCHGFV